MSRFKQLTFATTQAMTVVISACCTQKKAKRVKSILKEVHAYAFVIARRFYAIKVRFSIFTLLNSLSIL